ncbi:MAG: type II secretion system secretin GspD [Neomegalonema sp.]|nr:type II secretion system secretin GspD [Neomegalonema sp.]
MASVQAKSSSLAPQRSRRALIAIGALILAGLSGCTSGPLSTESRLAALLERDPAPIDQTRLRDAPPSPTTIGEAGPSAPAPEAVRVYGEDTLGGLAPSTRPRVEVSAVGGDLVVNFENADLREVVRLILGETLRANYLFDPRVSGTVSLETTRPLDADALLSVLETVLALNGAALIATTDENGVLYRIVPISEALLSEIAPVVAPAPVDTGASYQVRVAPLQYLAASEMAEILRPFLPDGGILRVDANRNLLMLAGSGPDIRRAVEIISVFDVDVLKGRSIGLFPVENVRAGELVNELQIIFDGGTVRGQASQRGEALGGLVTLRAIERINAVMVVTSRSAYLREAEKWIGRLDQGGAGGRNLYVYPVQHGKAADLAAVLSGLYGNASAAPSPSPRSVSEQTASSAPSSADPLAPLGLPAASETGISAEPVLAQSADAAQGGARFIADEVNNAVLIQANRGDYRQISAALRKLDRQPVQVLIEASVAEVTLTDSLRFGVQFYLENEIFNVNAASQLTRGDTAGVISASLPGYQLSIGSPIKVILDALDGVTDVNVISSPHLLVLDNQTAELNVGAEVPIARQQRQGINADDTLINTIEFRETGVTLRVTPRVNNAGTVTMEVEQEVSAVQASDVETLTPTITTRRFSSRVLAKDGATVVLGGLFQDSTSRTRSGLPVLQDIPVFGALFGSKGLENSRTELLVMITPRILRNSEDAEQAARELQIKLQETIQRVQGDTALRRVRSLAAQ